MARCFIPGVPRTPAPCDQPQLGFRRVAERHRRLSSAPMPESLGFPTSLRRSGRRRFGRGLRCLLSPFLASAGNGHQQCRLPPIGSLCTLGLGAFARSFLGETAP
jgi:hypothetical protein